MERLFWLNGMTVVVGIILRPLIIQFWLANRLHCQLRQRITQDVKIRSKTTADANNERGDIDNVQITATVSYQVPFLMGEYLH